MKSIIGVVGLGYVGLPVAAFLAKKFEVIGFDINEKRISELRQGIDKTGEISSDFLSGVRIKFTSCAQDLHPANFYIVAVPTPVDEACQPDLSPLEKASEIVGAVLKKGDIVVYESTVYPGVTEEFCAPILEKASGLVFKKDFELGYSPERINPGDKERSFDKITKVVSGSSLVALDLIDEVYSSVVTAGTYRASSIKTAEAAKVIENTQRDINIALMNELSLLFDRMELDTTEVLSAASTKWNFLRFSPGLVGGHCIGVDPYYLTHKAQMLGFHPEVILSGRRTNDSMGKFIAEKTIKKMIESGKKIKDAKVAVLGVTFKENCPDLRNSKVFDIIKELKDYGANISIYDPLISRDDLPKYMQHQYFDISSIQAQDAIILAVAHDSFKALSVACFREMAHLDGSVFIDVKSVFSASAFKAPAWNYWRL